MRQRFKSRNKIAMADEHSENQLMNARRSPVLMSIGLLVLVGLACKNAILIVEFARDLERQGRDRFTAALEAARIRLRPILMTSFAFIAGVVPLILASGAGAEMRRVMGIAVFSGMLGVTFLGLVFTPLFYVLKTQLEAVQSRTALDELETALRAQAADLALQECKKLRLLVSRRWKTISRASATSSRCTRARTKRASSPPASARRNCAASAAAIP